ncbi:hypothetical protein HK105_205635 [Polyrhizophydium stewartii]|uniref:Bud22 domain-containing protein n=1 Tax=Polyrhizophydium stewartii TaxID=2732419 RepID=A0ABR4N5S2_9FUNG
MGTVAAEETAATAAGGETPAQRTPDWTRIGPELEKKLFFYCKEAKRKAKQARTHELQRLIRKQRTAREKAESALGDDKAKLESESAKALETIQQLKAADVELTATRALADSILKSKLPDPPHIVGISQLLVRARAVTEPWTPAQHRIRSAKLLADAIRGFIEELDALIRGRKPATVRRAREKALAKAKAASARSPASGAQSKTAVAASAAQSLAHTAADASDDESDEHVSFSGDDRVAFSGDDDESAQDSEASDALAGPRKPASKPASKPAAKRAASRPNNGRLESMFVSSLGAGIASDVSMSDYSGAEFSGSDDDGDGDGKKNSKKTNRMGQRARQAMWEKKYGKDAKHFQKRKEAEEQERRAQRGANGARGGRGGARGGGRGGARGSSFAGGRGVRGEQQAAPTPAAAAPAAPAKPDLADLHPSWQAKRMKTTAIAEFKGTKVTFDDDGDSKSAAAASATKTAGGAGAQRPAASRAASAGETLHPSWEAKRRAKELEAKRLVPGKPTKIKFGDDD